MSVPKVRARLRELSEMVALPTRVRAELSTLADQLRRASPVRRSYVTSRRLTPALIEQIAAHVKANPNQAFHEIAAHFGVNPGRVSEVATGRRRPTRGR